jgi:ferredoxin--NADP+ reductase
LRHPTAERYNAISLRRFELATDGLNAVITRRVDLAPGLWIIHVAPDGWKLSDFQAGQYTTLGLPGTVTRKSTKEAKKTLGNPRKLIKRAYSIASSPIERYHLEFYLVLVSDGGLTPRLVNFQVGDRVWLGRKITGTFVLSRAPAGANLVFVATGTGIAPYISMLRTHLSPAMPRHIALVHGVRHSVDLAYMDELKSMARLSPRFTYIPTVSRTGEEPMRWSGRTGYVQRVWEDRIIDTQWGFHPTPHDTHIFLCGSPAMIDDMVPLLAGDGFTEHTKNKPGQVHVERYW